MKARFGIRFDMAVFPEDVGAGKRRMAAQVDLYGRSKPSKTVPVPFGMQKSGLREIHLARDILHPLVIAGRRKNTHGRRVAGERNGGESVKLWTIGTDITLSGTYGQNRRWETTSRAHVN